ncbi:hypothetical protein ACN47E_000607 [Coniothyrium glycines]
MVTREPATSARFKHSPLNLDAKQIRLLRIQPRLPNDDTIRIEIIHIDYSDDISTATSEHDALASITKPTPPTDSPTACPPYIALSYTWGPESPMHRIHVSSDNSQGYLAIRANLYDFLCIQAQCEEQCYYWIDQVCIDQDNIKERGHQVGQMAAVYSRAERVEAWLGAAFESSDKVMDLLAAIDAFLTGEDVLDSSHVIEMVVEPVITHYKHREAFARFLNLPYWSRLWVIQELVLNDHVSIRLGSKTLRWTDGFGISLLEVKFCCQRSCRYWECDTKIDRLVVLRDYKSYGWDRMCRLVEGSQCTDQRDMVFGIMGIIEQRQAFRTDYSLTAQQILLEIASTKPSDRGALSSLQAVKNWFVVLDNGTNTMESCVIRKHINAICSVRDRRKFVKWLWRMCIWSIIPHQQSLPWRMINTSIKSYRKWHLGFYDPGGKQIGIRRKTHPYRLENKLERFFAHHVDWKTEQ